MKSESDTVKADVANIKSTFATDSDLTSAVGTINTAILQI